MSDAISSNHERPVAIGRFAPSPSGRFHVGNVFSSMIATLVADRMILRIEDLDPDRSKQVFIDALMRDLDWFGFEWEGEVVYQSSVEHQQLYHQALASLEQRGLIYPCFCSRADLHSSRAPHMGEEFVYQNTCKYLSADERRVRSLTRDPALRLDVQGDGSLQAFNDLFQGAQTSDLVKDSGDFIVRRSDGVFAYQLAVVLDDADQGVTSVVRGVDLLASTPKQLLLQDLFDLPHPTYGHVPIFVDETGRKLSKRNEDASLSYLIEELELTPKEILGYLAFLSGIIPEFEAMDLAALRRSADLSALEGKREIVWKSPDRR